MNVNHVTELPDGTATFTGTLEGPELAIVIEAGLNYLLQAGALPFLSEEQLGKMNLVEPNDTTQ